VHLKQESVHDLRSCLGLLDRFLGDGLRYPLEWDDFVSWPHASPGIETVRENVAATEPSFFSSDPTERREGFERVLAERNRIAAIIGMPVREASAFGGLPPNTSLERTRDR
jgi:hypothetical protein